MTQKEVLDWLYRIKSKLKMYFPLKWVSECEQAIDYAINTLENQTSVISEFEKAKAEMKRRRDALDDGDLNDYKKCKMQGYSDSMGILDHCIEELEGK